MWTAANEDLSDNENECHRVDTPPFSEAGSPIHRENHVEEFMSFAQRRGSFVEDHKEEEPEDDIQQDSDEEYEEDVLEPRTLNEFTALTDRTSPWSSMVSEPGRDPQIEQMAMEDLPANGNLLERLSLVSSVHQDDQNSNPNSARSCDSNMADEYNKITDCMQGNGSGKPETLRESRSIESLSQGSSDLSDNGEEDRLRSEEQDLEVTRLPTEMSLSGSEPDESQDLAMDGEDTDEERRGDNKSGYPSLSSHPESSPRETSPFVQSGEEPSDMAEATAIPHFNVLYPYRCWDTIQKHGGELILYSLHHSHTPLLLYIYIALTYTAVLYREC